MRFRGLAIISFAFFCAIVHSIALAQGKNELMIESYDKLLGDFAKETGMAEKNLCKAFDKQIELVRKLPRFKAAEKQIQIESLRIEKDTFEQHGTIPFSPIMRVDVINYLNALKKAATPVATAYEKRISLQLKAKDDSAAGETRAEKERVLAPKILGRWRMEHVGGSGIYHYVLYSDGSINDGVGKIPTQWTLDKNNLLIVYQLPEGLIKDTCTIESFGQKLTSTRDKQNYSCNGFRYDE